jgi:hypothetical protein
MSIARIDAARKKPPAVSRRGFSIYWRRTPGKEPVRDA